MLLFLVLGMLLDSTQTLDSHVQGPSFVMEPPVRIEFANSSGGWLDCSATGNPQPSIDWLLADGTSVGDVLGIRKVFRNGTLVLYPFAAAAYRQDIHNTVYRCVASNSVGRIVSRDVQIRAVVTQAFRVDVEVMGAARGCTAILKCVIPPFVKDLVRVVSWIQEPAFFIYPSLQGDGKFHQLPSGELLIHNLEFTDQFPTYRCRTVHRLSRQVIVSNPANVKIIENLGIVSPVIIENLSRSVTVSQDEGAALICIAQGCPPPEYRWYSFSGMEHNLIVSNSRIRQLASILAIEAVTSEDGGIYKCTAFNAAGEASTEIRLTVFTPLHVEVIPAVLSVHIGGTAEFKCEVSMPHDGSYLVTWYKDGRQLPSTGRGLSEALIISNVGRDDRGMYQCIVRRADGDTSQAAAELQLGDAPPTLQYTFIEQTLQPGPAVSLKCSASGNPTPRIIWTLDGFPLPSHGRFVIGQYVTVHGDVISHVNISHVMVEDGGEYICTAENRAGRSSHSARLNVYGMPYIRLIPKVTAVAGEILQLKCPVAGYPIEEIHWERGGRELPDDLRQKVLKDGTLEINSVEKKTDSGVYTCWARNKQGQSARRSGEVSVIVPPKISPFYIEDNLHIGDRVSLTCSVTKGDLPLTIVWLKNGQMVRSTDMVSIASVDQFTSILVIEKLSQEHNGNYSCVVRNLAAEVSHTHRLMVNVPPIIEPFSFQDGLSEGMRTRTVCGVSSGDPPLVVSWLKDGQPLTPSLGVNVSALDPYSSLLSISSLDLRHSGDFTCVASNPAAEVRYTAKLKVKVPPRWEVEPSDVSVERNHQAVMHCRANGVPSPKVTWKRAVGGKSGDYEDIKSHTYTRLLQNGTLILQHVKEDREGYYLCQAENGVGPVIGKVIQLRVNSPPYFTAPSRLVSVKKGDTAHLKCDVNGDKPISVIWLRDSNTELNPTSNFRSNVKQDVTSEGVTAVLQISNAQSEDSGSYFCQASNMYGKDQQLIQLLVQEPPKKPQNVELVSVSSTSAQIKWQYSSSTVGEILKFIVEYREKEGTWKQTDFTNTPTSFSAVIEDLKPATRYTFRVIAVGRAGESLPSSEIVVETKSQRPTGPPVNVFARPISSTELIITWKPPSPELRHGEIQGFNIGYRSPNADNFNFTRVMGNGEDAEFLLGELEKYSQYDVIVQAFNEVGAGPLSEIFTTRTLEDVPSKAPDNIRCAALTSQSLQVSWLPPPNEYCHGILQGYKVSYEPIVENNWSGDTKVYIKKTSALTTVITGLKKFTNYSIQITAFTKIGDGASSTRIICQTAEDVPGHPADVKVAVSSSQSLRLSWLPPLEPNGILIKYHIYKRTMDGKQEVDHSKETVSVQHTSYEIKGVQVNVEYQLWVTCSTKVGEGQSSKVVTQVATSQVPARIISFGGTVIRPLKTSIVLACEAVGAPRRKWFRGETPIKSIVRSNQQILDTGELILSNVQLTDVGNYSCQVDNIQGSDKIIYNLLVQMAPAAPLLYVISATSNSVLLSWKVVNDGGAQISGFTLNYRKEHGNLDEIRLSRHLSGYELKDLFCGTKYYLYLTAHNVIGSSPASHPLQVRTQGQLPGVPNESSFLTPNSTSVSIRLQLWPDNGCRILYFVVQYKASLSSQWILAYSALKLQKRISITGLIPATQYLIKVEAHNTAGFSTGEFTFTTLSKEGQVLKVDTSERKPTHQPIYYDIKFIIIVVVTVVISTIVVTGGAFCLRKRRSTMSEEFLDNQQNIQAQKARYYATLHKAPLKIEEKVPETSEEISPYATFQLSEPSTLPQTTMFHNFMYRHSITDECVSSPPQTLGQRSSPYYHSQKCRSFLGYEMKWSHNQIDVDCGECESSFGPMTSSKSTSAQVEVTHHPR